jgi:hypothetical protein
MFALLASYTLALSLSRIAHDSLLANETLLGGCIALPGR